MLGLKLIKKSTYDRLQREIDDAQALLAEKYGMIESLEKEIIKLKKENSTLKKEDDTPKKRNTKTVLLTDVAETPLTVDEQPKKKRTTKKVVTK